MPVTWKIKKDWQTENERCGRGMVEFPPSRQSSSYIPIRGWHSLISHIITLVRGALRSLVGTEEEGRLGTVCPERRDDGGGGREGGGSWLFLQACLWGTDLRPPWVLIHRSPPPPPGGCSCPNGPAPPRVRASAKQPRATPHVRSFEGGLASCNGLLAALNFELVIITLWATRAPRLYRSKRARNFAERWAIIPEDADVVLSVGGELIKTLILKLIVYQICIDIHAIGYIIR